MKTTVPSQIMVLTNGDNASLAYLLNPFLAAQGRTISYVDLDGAPDGLIAAACCETIIIARYLSKPWVAPLRRFRAKGGRVVYFMDDDLMDPAATVGLPSNYAKKIRHLATRHRQVLESLCNEFWVASPHLAEKYRAWSPRLLAPRPALTQILAMQATTLCYHGTASHQAELEWLVPVIAQVQAAQAATSFEVFGDHATNRMFRSLPRVAVLHPMSWTNYLAYTASTKRDIALAPLLPQLFNAGRGPTKFFDFARMGAVGIYTDVAPYRGFIRDGVDGVLLPNEPALWMRTICELAADAPRRQRMARAAQERSLSMVGNPALPPATEAAPVELVAVNDLELLGCQT